MSNVSILKRSYNYAVQNAIHNGWLEQLPQGTLYLTDKGIDESLRSVNQIIKELEESGQVTVVKPRALAISRYLDVFIKSFPNAVQAFIHIRYFRTHSTDELIDSIKKQPVEDKRE